MRLIARHHVDHDADVILSGRKLTQTGQRDLDRIAGAVAVKYPLHATF